MCSICKKTLPGFGIPHTEVDCPLRKSQYCGICARYGHLTKMCSGKELRIEDNDAAIKQFLTDQHIRCKKYHKRALYHYADANQMRIMYLQ